MKHSRALEQGLEMLKAGHLSVDDAGRVWRHVILNHGRLIQIAARRAENVGGKGYFRITLHKRGEGTQSVMAHRLIWTWLRGPIPEGLQINHKDCCKTNNHLGNLEVVTQSENIVHSYDNGRNVSYCKATKWRGRDLITEEIALQIREDRASGMIYRELAAKYQRSITHIQRLCTR